MKDSRLPVASSWQIGAVCAELPALYTWTEVIILQTRQGSGAGWRPGMGAQQLFHGAVTPSFTLSCENVAELHQWPPCDKHPLSYRAQETPPPRAKPLKTGAHHHPSDCQITTRLPSVYLQGQKLD